MYCWQTLLHSQIAALDFIFIYARTRYEMNIATTLANNRKESTGKHNIYTREHTHAHISDKWDNTQNKEAFKKKRYKEQNESGKRKCGNRLDVIVEWKTIHA